jgi:hypothetical protein
LISKRKFELAKDLMETLFALPGNQEFVSQLMQSAVSSDTVIESYIQASPAVDETTMNLLQTYRVFHPNMTISVSAE